MDAADPWRWLDLGVIEVAKLMIVLDTTIVSIALRSPQRPGDQYCARRNPS